MRRLFKGSAYLVCGIDLFNRIYNKILDGDWFSGHLLRHEIGA